MNTELLEALTILEEEKDISKETMLDAIENSLMNACKNHFGKADNIKIIMNRETCDYSVFAEKVVVEEVEDEVMEISLADAKMIDSKFELGDIVEFGRIKGIRKNRHTECKKPDPPENPRGRKKSGL